MRFAKFLATLLAFAAIVALCDGANFSAGCFIFCTLVIVVITGGFSRSGKGCAK